MWWSFFPLKTWQYSTVCICILCLSIHTIISSVQSLSCIRVFVTPWTAAHQASLSITNSQSYSNSCPSSQWYYQTISSSVVHFSCLQSLPASESFPMSQLFASGGQSNQSIGVSASASVLPMNIRDRLPLGWIGWISLQSKVPWRVFFNTTVQKHQFFGIQLSLWPNSQIQTWLWKNHSFDYMDLSQQSYVSTF